MKSWKSKLWLVLPVLLLVTSSVIAWQILNPAKQKAAAVACTDTQATDFSCWQEYYQAVVDNESPEAAFADFRKAYDTNPFVKSQCHQIGHVIGRAGALKYKTLAETYAHGDTFCWSGYYHGAIEQIAHELGAEKIVAQINDVCESFNSKEPYSFKHYNCVHGMGHGLMAVKEDKLFEALDSCDRYNGSWQQDSCYGGVFMENVMNNINPGKTSAYLKTDDPLYPCTAVKERHKQQCYLMQTSHALTVVGNDYKRVFELCAGVESPHSATCYQSLGRDISGASSSQVDQTREHCMYGTTFEARDNCFTGAVKDFISYYHDDQEGLTLCTSIPDSQLSTNCRLQADAYYRTF